METNPSNKSRLQHQQKQEQTSEQQVTNRVQAAQEFDSVEDLLRFDASQTNPPASIAERLQDSLSAETPPPKRSWWQRLFGK